MTWVRGGVADSRCCLRSQSCPTAEAQRNWGPAASRWGGREAAGVGRGTRAGRTRVGEGLHQTRQTTQLPRQDACDAVAC